MATKQKETLEEGLNRSATKKGLTGKERKRYIGGTIGNLEKSGKIKVKHTPPPKRGKPVKPKEKIVLVAKKNAAASASRGYAVYSIYKKDGTQYNSATFRKQSAAKRSALDEQYAYNEGLKQNKARI